MVLPERSRTRSPRKPPGSSITTADAPQLGQVLRRRRLEQGIEIDDAARELGIPVKSLRAVEWDRRDLLGSPAEVERIERSYASLLGLAVVPPAPSPPQAPAARPAPRTTNPTVWLSLAGGVAFALVLVLVLAFGESPLLTIMLALTFLSALLLGAAVLPPEVVERTQLTPAAFARFRQPLALSAIGILIPITIAAVLIPLL